MLAHRDPRVQFPGDLSCSQVDFVSLFYCIDASFNLHGRQLIQQNLPRIKCACRSSWLFYFLDNFNGFLCFGFFPGCNSFQGFVVDYSIIIFSIFYFSFKLALIHFASDTIRNYAQSFRYLFTGHPHNDSLLIMTFVQVK